MDEIKNILVVVNVEMRLLLTFIVWAVVTVSANANCGCGSDRETKAGVEEQTGDADVCAAPADGQSKTSSEPMVFVKGQNFTIGTDKPVIIADGESPSRSVYLDSYFIDKYEVSNLEFKTFVDETGYKTEAETFGDSFVFQLFLSKKTLKTITQAVKDAPWWVPVKGACWKHSEGGDSNINGNNNHLS